MTALVYVNIFHIFPVLVPYKWTVHIFLYADSNQKKEEEDSCPLVDKRKELCCFD